jgi:hypothetical protein
MKALTVQNPWAFEITLGNKNVENRDWRPRAELPLQIYVHAGKAYDESAHYRIRRERDRIPAYRFGAIVAIVTVAAIHDGRDCRCACSPWAMPARWHWELTRAHAVNPTPCRGKLGLWTVPDIIAASLS